VLEEGNGDSRQGPREKTEKVSKLSFRTMMVFFDVLDFLYPYIKKRVKKFGIEEGMIVVDYGCGLGSYTTEMAELVGRKGTVYAVDMNRLAIEAVERKMAKYKLRNVRPILEPMWMSGYDSTLPNGLADIVCALGKFSTIGQPTAFLVELRRIIKDDGTLIIDDNNQPRDVTKRKILDSGLWDILEETTDHLKCRPRK
jgi:ubiquinone/menaquinone biosynthesis C-methylase UbiE